MRRRSLWILATLGVACTVSTFAPKADPAAALANTAASRPSRAQQPTLSFNHAKHLELGPTCTDCHDSEETGTPQAPSAEFCFECHEDLAEENETVNAYFNAIRQTDGTYKFGKLSFSTDLIVSHAGHAKYEVTCADCHGEPSEKAFARPDLMPLKQACLSCHTTREASTDCATCHKEIRKDQPPADHAEPYRQTHGRGAPPGWRDGQGDLCALCHTVPDSCNKCHAETPPKDHGAATFLSVHGADVGRPGSQPWTDVSCALCHKQDGCTQCHTTTTPKSHRSAAFKITHGRGDTDARDEPWADVSCSLCHKQEGCVQCHQTQKPRSHTRPWERRHHGISAGVNRDDCFVCHKQDSCVNCHQTARPVSHRGQWGTGQQSHCISCHEPLTASGCVTCHKSTLPHLQATTLPADARHLTSSDPVGCQDCHKALPHFDSGGRCRSCHR